MDYKDIPEDKYFLSADGTYIYFGFELKKDLLYRFIGTKTVFSLNTSLRDGWHIASPDLCPGIHLHGKHPCTGAPDPFPTTCGQGIVEKVP